MRAKKPFFFIVLCFCALSSTAQILQQDIDDAFNAANASCANSDKAIAIIRRMQNLIAADNSNQWKYVFDLLVAAGIPCPRVQEEANIGLAVIDFSDSLVLDQLCFQISHSTDGKARQAAFGKLMSVVLKDPCHPNYALLKTDFRLGYLLDRFNHYQAAADDLFNPIKGCPVADPNYKNVAYAYGSLARILCLELRLDVAPIDRFNSWGHHISAGLAITSPWATYLCYGWLLSCSDLAQCQQFIVEHPLPGFVYSQIVLSLVKPNKYYQGYGPSLRYTPPDDLSAGTNNLDQEFMNGHSELINYLATLPPNSSAGCIQIIDNILARYLDQAISEQSANTTQILSAYPMLTIGRFLAYCNYPHAISKIDFANKLITYRNILAANPRLSNDNDKRRYLQLIDDLTAKLSN